MAPSPLDTEENNSGTADMSPNSSDAGSVTSPSKRDTPKVKKRRNRKSRVTFIRDLSFSEQEKARKFDLNGDGELDDAELAMMRYDVDGDGNLTSAEIHAIVNDLLRDRSSISAMRKIIAGLSCFVLILSLSNLGTSIASALLVKETTADKATAEMKIVGTTDVMGTQASAETFEALQMDVDTRRARRNLVVDALMANPHDEDHMHRHLAKSKGNGKKGVKFDVNVMSQKDVENLKNKCEQGRNINVGRTFPGGGKDSKSICKSGSSIYVKETGKKLPDRFSHFEKGPRKKKGAGFQMTIRSGNLDTAFDCDGKDCYMSGSNLLNAHGEPCDLNHGSDDCEDGLVCIQNKNDVTSGTCSAFWDDATWYVDWDDDKCVQNCAENAGPNCGGHAGNWDEQFVTHKLCCDTFFSFLKGGYGACVPDLNFHLGQGRDCTDNANMCKEQFRCKKSNYNDRSYCS